MDDAGLRARREAASRPYGKGRILKQIDMDNRAPVRAHRPVLDYEYGTVAVTDNTRGCWFGPAMPEQLFSMHAENDCVASELDGFPRDLEERVARAHVDRNVALRVERQQSNVLFQQHLRFATAMLCYSPRQALLDNMKEGQLRSQQACKFHGALNGAIGAFREVRSHEQMLNRLMR